jgi:hypothetical protein
MSAHAERPAHGAAANDRLHFLLLLFFFLLLYFFDGDSAFLTAAATDCPESNTTLWFIGEACTMLDEYTLTTGIKYVEGLSSTPLHSASGKRHFTVTDGTLSLKKLLIAGGSVDSTSVSCDTSTTPDTCKGGAILVMGGSVELTKVIIDGCGDAACAYYGGGIYVTGEETVIRIKDSTIRNRVAQKRAGAIYASGTVTVYIQDESQLKNNRALDGAGGAIYLDGGAIVNIDGGGNTFHGNLANSAGKGHSISKASETNERVKFDVCPPGTLQGNLAACPGPAFCTPDFTDDGKNYYLNIDNDFFGCASSCLVADQKTIGWELHRGATKCEVPCDGDVAQYYNEHLNPNTECSNPGHRKFTHDCEDSWPKCQLMDTTDCDRGTYWFSPTSKPNDFVGATANDATCVPCPGGRYKGVPDFRRVPVLCKVCPLGKYTEDGTTGAEACTPCAVGRYQTNSYDAEEDHDNPEDCTECPKRTFSRFDGDSEFYPDSPDCYFCDSPTEETGIYDADKCVGCFPGQFTCPDGKTSRGGTEACETVATGETDSDADPCAPCPAGFYSDKGSSSECTKCPIGRYYDAANAVECKACERGRYNDVEQEDEACTPCAVGLFAPFMGAVACTACPAGTYSAEVGRDVCTNCAVGTYTAKEGLDSQADCSSCSQGRYNARAGMINHSFCLPCPRGRYQNDSGSSFCLPCNFGEYNMEEGKPLCDQCPAETYADVLSLSTPCKTCQSGREAVKNGSSFCSRCAPGKFVNETTDTCHVCPRGSYSVRAEAPSCMTCAIGKFKAKNESWVACSSCPAGWHGNVDSNGLVHCLKCETGLYQGKPGKTSCERCSKNSCDDEKHPNARGTACRLPETAKGKPIMTRKSCSDVDMVLVDTRPGSTELVNASDKKCEPCPKGAVCSSGRSEREVQEGRVGKLNVPGIWENKQENVTIGTSVRHVIANKGHWRVPWDFVTNPAHKDYAARHYLFAICPYPERCLGEPEMGNYDCHLHGERFVNSSANVSNTSMGLLGPSPSPSGTNAGWRDSCADGTHPDAVACAQCAPGWTSSPAGNCRPCAADNTAVEWIVVSVFVLVAGVFIALKHKCKKSLERLRLVWHDVLKLVTIIVSYQQVSSSVPTVVSIEWPRFYMNFLPYLNIFNLDFAKFLSFDCIFGVNYLETLYVYTFLPVLVLMYALINYRLLHWRLLKRLKVAQKNLRKLNKMWEKGLERAFDLIDDDDSGFLCLEELAELLFAVNSVESEDSASRKKDDKAVGFKPKYSCRQRCSARCTKETAGEKHGGFQFLNSARSIVKEYGEWDNTNRNVIYRSVFLENAQKDERFAGRSISQKRALILFSHSAQLVRNTYGTAFQIIFVMHAPLSVPAFKFFDCRDFGGRSFLHSDYTLDCAGDSYEFGRRFALSVITLFGIGLPVFFGIYIFMNRHRLHTAQLEAKVGWMYSSYRHGAEGWEIFQISRKIFLTGFLYLLGRQMFVKIMIGTLCGLLTLVLLVETRPFTSRPIFVVAVISGTCTCLKYAFSFLLMIPEAVALFTFTWEGTEKDRGNGIGLIFLLIDVVAFGCAIATFVRIFRKAKKVLMSEGAKSSHEKVEQERLANRIRRAETTNNVTKTTPKRGNTNGLRRSVSIAHDDHKVRKVRDAHETTIQLRKEKIARANKNASSRLQSRLKKRDSAKGSRGGGGGTKAVVASKRTKPPDLPPRPNKLRVASFAVAFARPLPKLPKGGKEKEKVKEGSTKIKPVKQVPKNDKEEAEGKKEKEKVDDTGVNEAVGDSGGVNDEKEVVETRLKLKKQIRKPKQLQKIYKGLCAKFKTNSFTVETFTLFLKMGLKRKKIANTFARKIWMAVTEASLSKSVTEGSMPVDALEYWIFTFATE